MDTEEQAEGRFEEWQERTKGGTMTNSISSDAIAKLVLSLKEKQGTERKQVQAMIDKMIRGLIAQDREELLKRIEALVEGYYHYQLVCRFCGNTWWGLHCPHDGYQNPCPACNKKPEPIKGNCTCELVAPTKAIINAIKAEI